MHVNTSLNDVIYWLAFLIQIQAILNKMNFPLLLEYEFWNNILNINMDLVYFAFLSNLLTVGIQCGCVLASQVHLQNCEKRLLGASYPSVRMEQLSSH